MTQLLMKLLMMTLLLRRAMRRVDFYRLTVVSTYPDDDAFHPSNRNTTGKNTSALTGQTEVKKSKFQQCSSQPHHLTSTIRLKRGTHAWHTVCPHEKPTLGLLEAEQK